MTTLYVKPREVRPGHNRYLLCCDDLMTGESHSHGDDGHEFPVTQEDLENLVYQIRNLLDAPPEGT